MINGDRQKLAHKIDVLIDGLFSIRRELLAHDRDMTVSSINVENTDDEWIEPGSAAERFNLTAGQIRRLARSGCGEKQGGRWLVNVKAIKLRLGR